MAKKKSVFTSEQGKTVSLSTKVSEELKARIDHINDRLAVLSGDKKLRFNVSSIMADAIEEAVEDAEKELETLEQVQPNLVDLLLAEKVDETAAVTG